MKTKPEDRFKEQKTYETFEQDAKASGLYDTFEQSDLDIAKQDVDYGYRLLKNKQGYVNADTEEDKQLYADIAAQDRAQYQPKAPTVPQGSGKQSDASANLLSIIKAYDDSLPGDKSSKWMKMVDSLFGQLAGDQFSYDPESDPLYAVSQKYAERAMKNQMAESALLTGGYGNSFGAAVGQQVYTDTMEDAVGELEQNAYNRWKAERDNKYNLLGIAQGLEQQEYERAENERQWAYQEAQDAKEEEWRNKEWNYGVEQDAKEEEWRNKEWNYGVAQDAATQTQADKESAQNRIMALLSMGGSAQNIPADLLQKSGFTAEELAQYEKYYKSLSKPDDAPILSREEAEKAYLDGKTTSNVIASMRYYYGDDFEHYYNADGAEPELVYSDAMNYLAGEGVDSAYTGLVMHPAEFENSLEKYGSVVAEIDGKQITFYSYADYVDKFAEVYGGRKKPDNGKGVTIWSESQFEARKRGGSVTFDGQVFDDYKDYKRYMEQEYAYEG